MLEIQNKRCFWNPLWNFWDNPVYLLRYAHKRSHRLFLIIVIKSLFLSSHKKSIWHKKKIKFHAGVPKLQLCTTILGYKIEKLPNWHFLTRPAWNYLKSPTYNFKKSFCFGFLTSYWMKFKLVSGSFGHKIWNLPSVNSNFTGFLNNNWPRGCGSGPQSPRPRNTSPPRPKR